jgi:excisionase family DNA binding protein
MSQAASVFVPERGESLLLSSSQPIGPSSRPSFVHSSNQWAVVPLVVSSHTEFCGGLYADPHCPSSAGNHGGGNMLNVEIRFLMQGKEVSVDSFVEAIVREVRASVREEITRTFPKNEQRRSDSFPKVDSAMPRQAVSIREAARLLSISPRIVENYIGLKAIRTVRVGRLVLVPMKSVNEVASRGIPWRRNQKPTEEQTG